MDARGLAGALVCSWFICCWLTAGAGALSADRKYEMVSPVFKGGFSVESINALSPDGQATVFTSPGAFNGAPAGLQTLDYMARRGVTGWTTAPLMPPQAVVVSFEGGDVTPSLGTMLDIGKPGTNHENPLNEQRVVLHSTELPDTVAGWEQVASLTALETAKGLHVNERAADPSFCHILLTSSAALLSQAVGTSEELYDVSRGCGDVSSSLELVGVNNKDELISSVCHVGMGGEEYAVGRPAFNAVSADGKEVFFTDCLNGETGSGSLHQVYVRLAGSRTLEVSRPLEVTKEFGGCVANGVPGEVPCEGASARPSADFAGASEDGSKVYFTTTAQLTPEDKDAENDLYMAMIGCRQTKPGCGPSEREVTSLIRVSLDPSPGEAARVAGVVRVAPDGSRVYFVAGGDLLTHGQREMLEGEGRPVPRVGAENLYLYNSEKPSAVAFIGDLCSGAELSGSVEDIRCPSSGGDALLWLKEESRAQTGGANGRFLVFATYAQLVSDDMNMARDVYRYDSESGTLNRVSIGENGYDANGNRTILNEAGEALGARVEVSHNGGPVRYQHEMDNRAVSEDGSRIVFTSAEPLSPAASNGLENAYEWREEPGDGEGRVSLISSGGSVAPVNEVVISPDGSSVLFATVEGLVPQDTDGVRDIYDARLGEGFPVPPAARRPCEGDACQGPLTNPAPLLVPGSVSQVPGGNFAVPKRPAKVKKAKPKARRRRGKGRRSRMASQRSSRFKFQGAGGGRG